MEGRIEGEESPVFWTHTYANEGRGERVGRKEGKKEEEGEEEEGEEGICSSGANYVNENGERIASVQ